MPTHHKIEVMPFSTPNFVTLNRPPAGRDEPLTPTPTLPIAELSVDTLEALCAQFRSDVFRKAGKQPA